MMHFISTVHPSNPQKFSHVQSETIQHCTSMRGPNSEHTMGMRDLELQCFGAGQLKQRILRDPSKRLKRTMDNEESELSSHVP